ncbi:hypothetical protein C8Q77DRAFT_173882 [Trametes polyzona]|nr:hypothetical protein C8Q77DRAFT_173882 [Trametes polyzona]
MADVTASTSELVGLWLQLLMTGAYLVYFTQCVTILRRRMRDGVSFALPIACGVIFVVTLADMVLALCRAHQAFAVNGTRLPDPEAYYANASTPLCVTKNALETVMTLVSDMIIAYRTYLIWDVKPLVILFPAGLLMTNVGLGVWFLWTLRRADDPATIALVETRMRYFFILTLCLNLFCGGMICWRIWTRSRGAAQYRQTEGLTRCVLETILQTGK